MSIAAGSRLCILDVLSSGLVDEPLAEDTGNIEFLIHIQELHSSSRQIENTGFDLTAPFLCSQPGEFIKKKLVESAKASVESAHVHSMELVPLAVSNRGSVDMQRFVADVIGVDRSISMHLMHLAEACSILSLRYANLEWSQQCT